MAKRWHPDIAPPGRRHEHQRHLQAINEAADELERLAESSRGGKVSRNAVKASAAADPSRPRGCRAPRLRERAARPGAGRRPGQARPVRLTRARPLGRPPLRALRLLPRVGRRDRQRHLLLRRRGELPAVGARDVLGRGPHRARPARCSSSTSPSPTRRPTGSQRFMTAAQHALAEGDAALAAQRLVYARDAEPQNPMVLRLLTAAFWQAGNLPAAARTVRDWARVDTDRPTPERFASRIYEDMGAVDLAAEAAVRAANRAPADASAWERLGRLRLRLNDRAGAISALERARLVGPSVDGPARPGARPPPGRRRRRRGLGGPCGHPDRSRLAARLVDLRPRAGPHRSPGRVRRGLPPGARAGQGRRGVPAAGARRGGRSARPVGAQRRRLTARMTAPIELPMAIAD